jgi:hypothetical protein
MTKSPFSLKLEEILMDRVRKQAQKEHRPVNNFIENVLLEYLNEQDRKDNPE